MLRAFAGAIRPFGDALYSASKYGHLEDEVAVVLVADTEDDEANEATNPRCLARRAANAIIMVAR